MDDNDNEFQEEGGLIDRIKESPRTVSALIIILIVAAAIYAFSGEEEGQVSETGEQTDITVETDTEITAEEQTEDEIKAANSADDSDIDKKEPKVAAETTTTKSQQEETKKDTIKATTEPLAEPSRTDTSFVEVAEAGNGVTHLARRASSRWLSENQAGYAVTDEHRIYIEDYIRRNLSSPGLAYGATMEISFDLIQEAVTKAQDLTESQLTNLSQYTHVLQ